MVEERREELSCASKTFSPTMQQRGSHWPRLASAEDSLFIAGSAIDTLNSFKICTQFSSDIDDAWESSSSSYTVHRVFLSLHHI